jgi:hypothetical protein
MLTFITNVPDVDLWARLAVGSIFFQTGHVMRHDIFSYLPTKDLWIDHEWGASVVFYFFAKYMGDWGIFALKAVILLTIFILIIKIIKLHTGKYAGVFYLTFTGFSLLPYIANLIRCQMFTFLFFTLWVYALERIRRGEDRLIWIFPATMLLWANMHGGFLAGIGLVFIYALGELFNRKDYLKYFGILAFIIPVTLINPYGWKFWDYIITAAIMPRPYIGEWASINISGPIHIFAGIKIHVLVGFMIFFVLMLVASIKLLLQKEKPDWTRIILFIVLLYLGIKHQRHTVFFVLAASSLFYHQYLNLFMPVEGFIKNKLAAKAYEMWEPVRRNFCYLMLGLICVYIMPRLSTSIVVAPSAYPVGSLEFIKQNNITGNLATLFDWGSYAFWKLYPQCKVLIDGRYEEVYPDYIYNEAMQFSQHQGDPMTPLRNYHTDILILPKQRYTPSDISIFTGWKPVYEDMVSVLFLPKDKIKSFYIYPDYKNPLYWKEDLSKNIPLD